MIFCLKINATRHYIVERECILTVVSEELKEPSSEVAEGRYPAYDIANLKAILAHTENSFAFIHTTSY